MTIQWFQRLLVVWMIGVSASSVWASLGDLTDLNKTKDPSARPGYYDAYKEQAKRKLQSQYQFLMDNTGFVQGETGVEEIEEILDIESEGGAQRR